MISDLDLPFKIVGDGSFILGGLNPDFVNVNGKKQLIELLGEPFHQAAAMLPNPAPRRTPEGKTEVYNSFGFDTLFIWSKELRDSGKVKSKLLSFVGQEGVHA